MHLYGVPIKKVYESGTAPVKNVRLKGLGWGGFAGAVAAEGEGRGSGAARKWEAPGDKKGRRALRAEPALRA